MSLKPPVDARLTCFAHHINSFISCEAQSLTYLQPCSFILLLSYFALKPSLFLFTLDCTHLYCLNRRSVCFGPLLHRMTKDALACMIVVLWTALLCLLQPSRFLISDMSSTATGLASGSAPASVLVPPTPV